MVSGLACRLIPCLDIDQGRVVKGVRFEGLRDAGNPVTVARRYAQEGADEIAFLDIGASVEKRQILIETVRAVAEQVFIPLTVGGGVRSLNDVRQLLCAGADKLSINSAALANPTLVAEAAEHFGSQCVVVAIDARRWSDAEDGSARWQVYSHGGRHATGKDARIWAQQVAQLGAGEILLTSMDRDGTRNGFDLALTKQISAAVSIPVIASGGVGTLEHLYAGIRDGGAAAVLAASIFHFAEYSLSQAKDYLAARGIPVRL